MSELTEALPKKVTLAWRAFLATDEGQMGLDWLMRNYRRTTGTETDMQMVRAAARWEGYLNCLDEIQERLTVLPTKPVSLDEAPLNQE